MDDKELIAGLIVIIASLLDDKDPLTRRDIPECIDLINRWVKSEKGRQVLKRHMLDGLTIEQIAEEVDRSPRQTARILKRSKEELMKHV